MTDVVALVPAAGSGVRLGENMPKAFVELAGRTLLEWALDGLSASGALSRVVVVVPNILQDTTSRLVESCVLPVDVVVGGAERTDSVRAGLAVAGAADIVLVHDAARCLTPPSLITRVVEAVGAGASAVVPVLPVVDTMKSVDAAGVVTGTVDRATLRSVQTPQGFDGVTLRRAYDSFPDTATDDAGLVERLGVDVHTVVGDAEAFKITTPMDLVLARALVARRTQS
ncbi:2-C-methyl-D-erythritol 4-phosphate cytidylyltransferase [Rhodococcus sp. BP-316]|uniref:2-C-methyl-D-erythritol 4-phosphate cytidylyltransferase n=1 Tax=unclassified Rhodococcus (in: high G+C Gram-positive bacteria) TaxID=192944 RepID=UPI001C9AC794|nr:MULTISPECIES: 2-C-methyl-D-erythritol 4-phosphate cytidylyltransferase [unclassified Rhodococcus (in: high G+C Gram-positive bacteria)]MBY6678608.1 2-C-methyl-D-erythritol 4-phosphate cytidylyltransferase [Rhodococcus sp. BP-332]MBY6682025.1 2-C-methyl-D-erythritol 4-phosphate cytidylyltransferase [Rhodococcus sp. BP-316]